jgi:carboxylesterase type B
LEFFEPIGPWIDGDEVKREPMESAHRGEFLNIPIMIGTLSEETRIYVYWVCRKKMSRDTFFAVLFLTNPLKVHEVMSKYSSMDTTDFRDVLVELSTDFIFTCTARNVTRSLQKLGHTAGMYTYIYNHALSFQGWKNFSFCQGHVCHGSELPFLFHTPHLAGFNMTSEEEKLSSELIHYWTNFAYTSNPNEGPHAVDINWPAYHSNQIQEWYMHFQTPNNEVLTQYRKGYCQFWNNIGYFV